MDTLIQTWNEEDKLLILCDGAEKDKLEKSWLQSSCRDGICKPDRITELYIDRVDVCLNSTFGIERITEEAYRHMRGLVCSVTRTYKRIVSILKRLMAQCIINHSFR